MRPPIPPDQLVGKIARARAETQKAEAQAQKLFDKFIETADDKIMEHWLRAYDRSCDLAEEEGRLILMREQWKAILTQERAELEAQEREAANKLKTIISRGERVHEQLRMLFFG